MNIGDVRIVKVDEHNYAVQKYEKPMVTKKTKHFEARWVDKHYAGHKLEWAAKWALLEAAGKDVPITREYADSLVRNIVDATKAHVGECKHPV
jgi:hypothetical protein